MEDTTAKQRLLAAINAAGMMYDFNINDITIIDSEKEIRNSINEGHVRSTQSESLFNVSGDSGRMFLISITHNPEKGLATQSKMGRIYIQRDFQKFFAKPPNQGSQLDRGATTLSQQEQSEKRKKAIDKKRSLNLSASEKKTDAALERLPQEVAQILHEIQLMKNGQDILGLILTAQNYQVTGDVKTDTTARGKACTILGSLRRSGFVQEVPGRHILTHKGESHINNHLELREAS